MGEIALGAAGGARVGSVRLVSACARDIVQTIVDPDPQSEAGFGAAVTPLGDVNGDGMLDLVVGVPAFDAGQQSGPRTGLPADQQRAGRPGARGLRRAAPPAAVEAAAAATRRLRPTTTRS